MQDDAVRLVGNGSKQPAFPIGGIDEQASCLIAVAGEDYLVERLFAARFVYDRDAALGAHDPAHAAGEFHAFAERPKQLVEIVAAAAGHCAPLVLAAIDQPVIVEEIDELLSGKLQHAG